MLFALTRANMFERFICQQVYHESSTNHMLEGKVLFFVQTHYSLAFFWFLSWKALCIAGLFSWSPRRVHAAQQWVQFWIWKQRQ